MHGRRREEYKARLADPKIAANLAQKAQQWNTLHTQLLSGALPQAFQLTEKLLLVNPDPLVLWNTRRTLLLEDIDITTELSLTAKCLERNPKAYGAWFHRKWCLCKFLHNNDDVLKKELELCELFLLKDERNFHCWNYRRFIVGLLLGESWNGSWQQQQQQHEETSMGPQVVATTENKKSFKSLSQEERQDVIQAEWDFTTTKISQNFSNYSAFHYRSKLLLLMNNTTTTTTTTTTTILLKEELELVHNAIFTEPDDQTAWWYHRFLLVEAFATVMNVEVLREEQELILELNQAEDFQSKWAWLGLLVVLQQLQKQGEAVDGDIQECLERLVELDPDRAARYASIMKQQQE